MTDACALFFHALLLRVAGRVAWNAPENAVMAPARSTRKQTIASWLPTSGRPRSKPIGAARRACCNLPDDRGPAHLRGDYNETRNRRDVVGAIGAVGRGDEAPLCRRRLLARDPELRLSQGSPRSYRHLRPHGSRARQADARGRDFPHLLDEQAD